MRESGQFALSLVKSGKTPTACNSFMTSVIGYAKKKYNLLNDFFPWRLFLACRPLLRLGDVCAGFVKGTHGGGRSGDMPDCTDASAIGESGGVEGTLRGRRLLL